MFHSPFYHFTMRKAVASFGSLFANIFVVKRDKDGKEVERVKVPLAYGPAERYIVRNQEDPELSRNYALKLPRMSFEIKSLEYDSQRKLNTLRKNIQPLPEDPTTVVRQYQGVPYKMTIELSIISKFIDDSNQIIEQILPWFTPAYTVTIRSIPGMNFLDDVAITLNSLNLQDNYEDDWTTRRDVIWTLSFDLKVMFYGPTKQSPVIQRAIQDIYAANGDLNDPEVLAKQSRAIRSTITPNPDNVNYNEEFGYSETIESFTDGMRLNPITGEDEPIED
jgi:hypothetical protein